MKTHLWALSAVLMVLMVMLASCGQTYHLQSITFSTPSSTIDGVSNYATFKVLAQLSNGQTEDVTSKVTWKLAAPSDLPSTEQAAIMTRMSLVPGSMNQVQALGGVCTWNWAPTADSTGKITYAYTTDPFTLTATYDGMTAQATVSVDSIGGCYDGIKYPAPTGDSGYSGFPFYN